MKITLNKVYILLAIISLLWGGWKELTSRKTEEEKEALTKKLQEVHQTATTITNYNNFYTLPREIQTASSSIVAISSDSSIPHSQERKEK
ncbi:MAG: hypothetical protein A3I73_00920 [Omnitrophica bacterium RIFCSPLOWO2_02_FULL_45_16]|nr:MAG: hypothetical protein A3C51_04350 [Omnitrophica bacterium RIFCSPHIGHO2_02_FULL_46_20]OGX00767.1 MAG: hypothetical protein A3I73_00920 [Omnitrophica bacterium RIFCSPLOWO2_02_FULL_45_16]